MIRDTMFNEAFNRNSGFVLEKNPDSKAYARVAEAVNIFNKGEKSEK